MSLLREEVQLASGSPHSLPQFERFFRRSSTMPRSFEPLNRQWVWLASARKLRLGKRMLRQQFLLRRTLDYHPERLRPRTADLHR